jgi:membrane protease YdiL (CAAX protease family)
MKAKLNAKSASLVVLLYLVLSILAALLAAIFFGGIDASDTDRLIDGVIDSGMVANILVLIILLFISLYVFKASRRDIFFERKPFALSKLYYLFPFAWFAVTVVALLNVDYSAYSLNEIILVLIAALTIGVNEEIVTRGILLIGLRNSRLDEWKAWLVTVAAFALLHLVNVLGGGSPAILIVTFAGGTLLYVARRTFNNLFVPIGLHALYDTAFFLLTGKYLVGDSLPDSVLDLQLASFLVLFVAAVLFPISGRRLLKNDMTGWSKSE